MRDAFERSEQTIRLFSAQLAADHVTHMCMRGENNALKYVLIHATNHPRGRVKMKEAMWSVKPDGVFTAHERHSPKQLVLISPEPDLEPLRRTLWARFAGCRINMAEMYDWLLSQLYLPRHLHRVLRIYRRRSVVEFHDYDGRFAFGKNPTVAFPGHRPADDTSQ